MKKEIVEKRKSAILEVIQKRAIEYEEYYFMDLWLLAFHINNTWKSSLFVNTKKYPTERNIKKFGFALETYDIGKLLKKVENVIIKHLPQIEIIRLKENNCWYIKVEVGNVKR